MPKVILGKNHGEKPWAIPCGFVKPWRK